MFEEYVYVPVRKRWVPKVFELVTELEQSDQVVIEEPEPPPVEADGNGALDPALVRRMYEESQEPHRRLMEYLAERPGEVIYTRALAEALGLPNGARSLAGMLGAFGRRAEHRYGGSKPWESEWDPAAYEAKHRMAPEVAEQIKKIATS